MSSFTEADRLRLANIALKYGQRDILKACYLRRGFAEAEASRWADEHAFRLPAWLNNLAFERERLDQERRDLADLLHLRTLREIHDHGTHVRSDSPSNDVHRSALATYLTFTWRPADDPVTAPAYTRVPGSSSVAPDLSHGAAFPSRAPLLPVSTAPVAASVPVPRTTTSEASPLQTNSDLLDRPALSTSGLVAPAESKVLINSDEDRDVSAAVHGTKVTTVDQVSNGQTSANDTSSSREAVTTSLVPGASLAHDSTSSYALALATRRPPPPSSPSVAPNLSIKVLASDAKGLASQPAAAVATKPTGRTPTASVDAKPPHRACMRSDFSAAEHRSVPLATHLAAASGVSDTLMDSEEHKENGNRDQDLATMTAPTFSCSTLGRPNFCVASRSSDDLVLGPIQLTSVIGPDPEEFNKHGGPHQAEDIVGNVQTQSFPASSWISIANATLPFASVSTVANGDSAVLSAPAAAQPASAYTSLLPLESSAAESAAALAAVSTPTTVSPIAVSRGTYGEVTERTKFQQDVPTNAVQELVGRASDYVARLATLKLEAGARATLGAAGNTTVPWPDDSQDTSGGHFERKQLEPCSVSLPIAQELSASASGAPGGTKQRNERPPKVSNSQLSATSAVVCLDASTPLAIFTTASSIEACGLSSDAREHAKPRSLPITSSAEASAPNVSETTVLGFKHGVPTKIPKDLTGQEHLDPANLFLTADRATPAKAINETTLWLDASPRATNENALTGHCEFNLRLTSHVEVEKVAVPSLAKIVKLEDVPCVAPAAPSTPLIRSKDASGSRSSLAAFNQAAACFHDLLHQAIRDTGPASGLSVMRIIHEPAAAPVRGGADIVLTKLDAVRQSRLSWMQDSASCAAALISRAVISFALLVFFWITNSSSFMAASTLRLLAVSAQANMTFGHFALFTRVAMAPTAFLVLARILTERTLLYSRVSVDVFGNDGNAAGQRVSPFKAKVNDFFVQQWAVLITGDAVAFRTGNIALRVCKPFDAIASSIHALPTGESLPAYEQADNQCFPGFSGQEGIAKATSPSTVFERPATLIGSVDNWTGPLQKTLAGIDLFWMVITGLVYDVFSNWAWFDTLGLRRRSITELRTTPTDQPYRAPAQLEPSTFRALISTTRRRRFRPVPLCVQVAAGPL